MNKQQAKEIVGIAIKDYLKQAKEDSPKVISTQKAWNSIINIHRAPYEQQIPFEASDYGTYYEQCLHHLMMARMALIKDGEIFEGKTKINVAITVIEMAIEITNGKMKNLI